MSAASPRFVSLRAVHITIPNLGVNLKIIERAFTFRLWEELKTALNESEFSQSEAVRVKALAPFQQLARKQRDEGHVGSRLRPS